jgi:hypothetical protein
MMMTMIMNFSITAATAVAQSDVHQLRLVKTAFHKADTVSARTNYTLGGKFEKNAKDCR